MDIPGRRTAAGDGSALKRERGAMALMVLK